MISKEKIKYMVGEKIHFILVTQLCYNHKNLSSPKARCTKCKAFSVRSYHFDRPFI